MNDSNSIDKILEDLIDDIYRLYEDFVNQSGKHESNTELFDFVNSFYRWKQFAKRALYLFYKDDIVLEEFNRLSALEPSKQMLSELVGLFESLRQYPNPIPTKVENSNPTLQIINDNNCNQNQTQSQSITIDNEIIKQELSVEQIEILEEILKSSLPKEKKKESIIKSLVGFGKDVAAGVLATLLTR